MTCQVICGNGGARRKPSQDQQSAMLARGLADTLAEVVESLPRPCILEGKMTVIAWDGKTISSDKQGNCSGLKIRLQKIMVTDNGELLAHSGLVTRALQMIKWYTDGKSYPLEKPTDKDDYANLIVAKDGKLTVYENSEIGMEVLDKFRAWGSGRDFAMGAMAMGANSAKAVEIASMFDPDSGIGIETYTI